MCKGHRLSHVKPSFIEVRAIAKPSWLDGFDRSSPEVFGKTQQNKVLLRPKNQSLFIISRSRSFGFTSVRSYGGCFDITYIGRFDPPFMPTRLTKPYVRGYLDIESFQKILFLNEFSQTSVRLFSGQNTREEGQRTGLKAFTDVVRVVSAVACQYVRYT